MQNNLDQTSKKEEFRKLRVGKIKTTKQNEKINSTIVEVAMDASSLGAWKAYNAYGATENSLLTENIEALTSGDAPGDAEISNKVQK
ncbi:hypothetical protein HMPREF1981_00604 [Bacteroides pyogenes F0041]|uniref:Uncharacterized protein n=1 Tax=Bacteroides pyogenes F0041 TaxID=1321819 RepID=U2CUK1_9BACE|nr:hypothetical protein [Bacteroides pyogenes]ERI88220.1 hypothetical protein HMPREF1981_00604 [Bacteroides pyogenes F0041]MDY5354276.1 hypothetical protein [Bacteroides pyogenes]